jgi:hypothetical protein
MQPCRPRPRPTPRAVAGHSEAALWTECSDRRGRRWPEVMGHPPFAAIRSRLVKPVPVLPFNIGLGASRWRRRLASTSASAWFTSGHGPHCGTGKWLRRLGRWLRRCRVDRRVNPPALTTANTNTRPPLGILGPAAASGGVWSAGLRLRLVRAAAPAPGGHSPSRPRRFCPLSWAPAGAARVRSGQVYYSAEV